jgi:GH25 family lysozyme M1 (1,4-beta-N-acetylmuramidase)
MKRNLSHSRRAIAKSFGTTLLAVSLLAGPGLVRPVAAVEAVPAPSTTASPSSNETAASPEQTATQTSALAEGAAEPEPAVAPPVDAKSMADAVGVGGAQMGQRSARVTASASSDSLRRLGAESLSFEGTWMPTFGIQGLDVSGHQPSVDWQQQWNMGARFAYVKATEGNYYTNPSYTSQYEGSRSVGMIRGAYHFAVPNWSSGADQARYFVQNGGGWTPDGYTMPPVLDFEFNPYEGRTINGFYFGNTCYDMSPAQLQSWVRDFGNTVRTMTGRLPVIYTNTSWWNQCLGNPSGFGDYPLWIAAYPGSPTNNAGPVPTGSWGTYSMWQYSSTGPFAGDSNVWNGDFQSLQRFANNRDGVGSTLVKGTTSSTVYVVSGTTKYSIPDWTTYQLYASISSIYDVSQTYLDSLSNGNSVGRFARNSDGTIYFLDSGRKHHVPSCGIMNDFGGGNCSGWVPLAPNQIELFTSGDNLANATVSPAGRLFYVSAGTKREFFDVQSLASAGLPTATAGLTDAAIGSFPLSASAPLVRPEVIVVDRVSRQPYIYTAGRLVAVPESINRDNKWANALPVAALEPQSLTKMEKAPAFTGFAANETTSAGYVIGSQEKFPMTDSSQWPGTVTFSTKLLGMIITGPSISSPAFAKTPSSPVVFRTDKKTLREVPDLTTLTQLGLGSLPYIYSLTPPTLDSMSKGPALLPLATLVVGETSPTVFLVDGADKLLQLEDFRISNNLGITEYSRLPQSALAPYTSMGTVQPVVRCGSATYLGYRGSFWKLASTTATAQLPSRSLEASTCSGLPPVVGSLNSTVFVKSLDSPTVYLVADGKKRPVTSWNRLVELNGGGSSPVIAEYSRMALDAVPTGASA